MILSYTAQDRAKVRRELARKLTLFCVLLAAVIAACIVLCLLRLQFWTSVLTLVCGAALLFVWAVFVSPPLRYDKLLKEMARGQQRVTRGAFVQTESELQRDGLMFFPFLVESEQGEARRLYWDRQKDLPAIAPGQVLELTTYGQILKQVRILDGWQ